jgi:hypothetical protein
MAGALSRKDNHAVSIGDDTSVEDFCGCLIKKGIGIKKGNAYACASPFL